MLQAIPLNTLVPGQVRLAQVQNSTWLLYVEDTTMFVQKHAQKAEGQLHLMKRNFLNKRSPETDGIDIRRLWLVLRRVLMNDVTTSPGKYVDESTDIHLLV